MIYNASTGDLDSEFFSTWLKKMDDDVAAGFVLSGLTLDKEKILEAFDTACQVMHIRAAKKEEELKEKLKREGKEVPEMDNLYGTETDEYKNEFVKEIGNLLESVLGTGKKKKDPDSEK